MTTVVHQPTPYRADLLRAEKGKRRWTNDRIAVEAGVSIPTVRAVLNGDSRVLIETVEKVGRALGLTMQQLFEPETATA